MCQVHLALALLRHPRYTQLHNGMGEGFPGSQARLTLRHAYKKYPQQGLSESEVHLMWVVERVG
jgi:hypothetical protein